MATVEELTGLLKGLADVVKSQQQANATALQQTTEQLQNLSSTVETLSKTIITPQTTPTQSSNDSPTGLRLPNITLPIYTGKENLDRFIDQITSLLQSSGVAPRYPLTYLKQQTQKDARAYDTLYEAEKLHKNLLGDQPDKASRAEFTKYFDACVGTLRTKRGKWRDQQIRDLLHQYYTMQQGNKESVAEFVNGFTQTQLELEKLVPNIHCLPTTKDAKDSCSELELIHAFVIKLKDPIKKDLVSREFKYSSLQSLIEAAQRYEDHKAQDTKDITNWTPDVLYSGYGPTRLPNHGNQGQGTKSKRSGNFSGTSGQPAGTNRSRPSSSNFSGSNRPNNSNPYHKGQGKQSQGLKSGNDRFSNAGNLGQSEAPICFAFNQYGQAFCELPNNQCNHKRLHKCQTCGRWGCKSRNHSQ